VRGTSIEFLQGVSDFLGIGGGFAQMLADNLEIGRTEEFLDTHVVVAWPLRQHYLGSHPGHRRAAAASRSPWPTRLPIWRRCRPNSVRRAGTRASWRPGSCPTVWCSGRTSA
jgi:hypothetical protein